MNRRIAFTMLVATSVMAGAASLLMTISSTVQAQETGCYHWLRFYNGNRFVYGGLSAECSFPHTPPWSNFGLESPYCSRIDGFQWPGWKDEDETLQWNACQTSPSWMPPNCSYYNHNDCWNQESNDQRHYGNFWGFVPGSSCIEHLDGQVYTVGSTFFEVWDLDDNWVDENLGTVSFPETNIPVSCNPSTLTCYGESGWVDHSSAPNTLWSDLKISLDAFVGTE